MMETEMAEDFYTMLARKPAEARKEARKAAAPSRDETADRRKKFVETIDRALTQLKKNEEKPSRGSYIIDSTGIVLRPKVGRMVMRVFASGEGGDKFDFIPTDEPFKVGTAYFQDLKAKAEAGKIDSWLLATLNGDAVPKGQGGKPKLDAA